MAIIERVDFDRINDEALARLPDLLARWLPDGRARRGEWVAKNPRRDDRRPGSFGVNLRTGRWHDFATGEGGGDPVSLIAYLSGARQVEAAQQLAEDFGVAAQVGSDSQPRRSVPQARQPVDLTPEQQRNRTNAGCVWREALPLPGTIAERYLAEARAIPAPHPPSLRFHPRCPRGQGQPLPALVAAIIVPATGQFVAIHRIYLEAEGRGKADLPRDQQKRTLGPSSGGAVVLGDLAAGEAILESEGIETALSAMTALNLPGIATLSISTLGKSPLPAGRPVIVLADRGGEAMARAAAERRAGQGHAARVIVPPAAFKDFNDLARGISS